MTDDTDKASQQIMDILLALPWDKREQVISAVRCNDIFCFYCGFGEPDHPNRNCQCTNDD